MHRWRGVASFLFLVLATLLQASASDIDGALQLRQNAPVGTGASASTAAASSASANSAPASSKSTASPTAVTTSASPSSTSTPSTSDQPRTTSSGPTTNGSPTAAHTSSQLTSRTSPADDTSSQSTQSLTGAPTSSTDGSSSQGSPASATPSAPPSSRTQQIVTTVVTISGSSTISHVLTTNALVAVTSAPGLDGSDGTSGNSGSSGLEASQKRIVIGVVVGVGGAALVGGLALVAWRIWGRKSHSNDEDDLMDSQPGSSGHQKTSSISGNSPFRSTLDQYHNPAGPVNTSSNF
ncbi:hypothetical protein MMC08_006966 [Hypocenomyce scalaris]|nr:hypothetical protein [Hypocenomyce scalaris]